MLNRWIGLSFEYVNNWQKNFKIGQQKRLHKKDSAGDTAPVSQTEISRSGTSQQILKLNVKYAVSQTAASPSNAKTPNNFPVL